MEFVEREIRKADGSTEEYSADIIGSAVRMLRLRSGMPRRFGHREPADDGK